MGFAYRRVLALEFADPRLEELEVKAAVPSMDVYFDTLEAADKVADAETLPETRDALDVLLRAFAPALVSWNVTDHDDAPVPATLQGLRSLDILLAQAIVRAWQEGISAVSGPLDETSADGEPSVEVSIPMEPLSESLAS